MAAKKKRLNEEEMNKTYFENAAFLGIISTSPAYKLCWLINNYFDISFVCDTEQTLELIKKKKKYYLPVFEYLFPNSSYKYLLYKLRFENYAVLQDIKHMDYLWVVQTAAFDKDANSILEELVNIPEIAHARLITKDEIKEDRKQLVT